MGLFNKKSAKPADVVAVEKETPSSTVPTTPAAGSVHSQTPAGNDNVDVVGGQEVEVPKHVPILAYIVGGVASVGGFMFGYESGQISGMLPFYQNLCDIEFPNN